jgi:hypothetical protein
MFPTIGETDCGASDYAEAKTSRRMLDRLGQQRPLSSSTEPPEIYNAKTKSRQL